MDMRDIVAATAKATGKLNLPDGHSIVRRRVRWCIYTPDGREIHFAADGEAEVIKYRTWEEALAEYERTVEIKRGGVEPGDTTRHRESEDVRSAILDWLRRWEAGL